MWVTTGYNPWSDSDSWQWRNISSISHLWPDKTKSRQNVLASHLAGRMSLNTLNIKRLLVFIPVDTSNSGKRWEIQMFTSTVLYCCLHLFRCFFIYNFVFYITLSQLKLNHQEESIHQVSINNYIQDVCNNWF